MDRYFSLRKVGFSGRLRYTCSMQLDQMVAEALKLHPRSRAQLAGALLQSLDKLTAEQNEEIWAEEADRRDSEPDATDRPADEVFRELRRQLT